MESRKKWFGVPIHACSFWTYFLAWRISENLCASIYCTMFRALQHDFGLLLAFFHQQHKRKCSNVFQACHHPCGRNGWRTVAKSNLNFAAFSHVLLLVFLTCFSRTELMTISFHLEAKFERKLHRIDKYNRKCLAFFPPIFQIWPICINEPQNEKFPRIKLAISVFFPRLQTFEAST